MEVIQKTIFAQEKALMFIGSNKMTNLTEQWKNGKLEEGFYYIKVKPEIANYIIVDECVSRLSMGECYTYFIYYEENILEVIAPCDYEELQRLKEENDFLDKECKKWSMAETEATMQNVKLREMLRECKKAMEKAQKNYGYDDTIIEILEPVTTKIDEVLNEKS